MKYFQKGNVRTTFVFIVITIALCSYMILNTRFGVHIALDVISEMGEAKEVQTSAADSPLKLTAQLSPIEIIPLPSSIQQPSGIKHRNNNIYISTDQTEVFTLDNNFNLISEPFDLMGGPLLFKQGSLEGIEINGDTLFAIGEFGALPTWLKNDQAVWTRSKDTNLPEQIAETEFSGITDSPKGRFATSEDHHYIINLDDGSTVDLSFEDFLKKHADVESLTFSGIAYADGYFYLLSENHTSIILLGADTFRVEHVFGINTSAASDLSVYKGKAYVVIDHNYNEDIEPIQVYDMETAMGLSSKENN